jgi:hypothetical protein
MRWYQTYTELKHFIAGNRETEIDKDVITIPRQVRSEFCRLFDRVRTAFIEEEFPDLPFESGCLSESYTKVEEEVINLKNWEQTFMSLQLALTNPS